MSIPSSNSPRTPTQPSYLPNRLILIAIYILLTLAILFIALMMAMRTLTPLPLSTQIVTIPTRTPTSTLTPTSTASLTPTRYPTFTLEPTLTPSTTPTPTATPSKTTFPTLTPAFPLPTKESYHLQPWTPELAEQMIRLMEAYPDTLSTYARGVNNAGYYAAYQYAIFALQEALLRFPNASFAQDWLWRLAYHLAQMGDPRAAQYYAVLIADRLDRQQMRMEELSQWGISQDPPVDIRIIPLGNHIGVISNAIVQVSIEDHGAAVIWLVETPDGYKTFALSSDFDFLNPTGVSLAIGDLTGDGNNEVIISRSPLPGSFQYPLPRIFSLVTMSPIELTFAPVNPPEVGANFQNHWSVIKRDRDQSYLQFSDTLFPPCPVNVKHTYQWNGQVFVFLEASYEIQPNSPLLSYCESVIHHAIQAWGLQATVQLMETLLPNWPPQTTSEGKPYPKGALDEWRYRLGLYHALLGNYEVAIGYLQGVLANPADSTSTWVASAQRFLRDLQSPKDIYLACLRAPLCDPRLAFQSLVRLLSQKDYVTMAEVLKEAGVTLRASGYFDFQNDGFTERWVILRHKPIEKLEFWIISTQSDSFKATFVDTVETNQPKIEYADLTQEPPVIRIAPDIFFQFHQLDEGQEPFVTFTHLETTYSTDLTYQTLHEIEARLLNGEDVKTVWDQLLALAASPYFTCDYRNCPYYLYLLGLVNELLGNERGAVNAYHDLWQNYGRSPYASMARLKLAGVAVPPSPTPSMTPTITPTPTITGTLPTLTPTITGTLPTATPTKTIAPTVTSTSQGYP